MNRSQGVPSEERRSEVHGFDRIIFSKGSSLNNRLASWIDHPYWRFACMLGVVIAKDIVFDRWVEKEVDTILCFEFWRVRRGARHLCAETIAYAHHTVMSMVQA